MTKEIANMVGWFAWSSTMCLQHLMALSTQWTIFIMNLNHCEIGIIGIMYVFHWPRAFEFITR